MTGPSAPLHRTPLADWHRAHGGRMVDFAGWEMPVQYAAGGIIAEHTAVREGCGIFDLSHMGRVYVRGADALALAQLCASRDLARIPAGEAAYALLCREDGGIADDVIAYVLGPNEVLFVFNASNREKDLAIFEAQRRERGFDATLDDRTFATALIGVQGPQAQERLQPLCDVDLDPLPGYAFVQARVLGQRALVARTGYTGEDGFEVLTEGDDAEQVWSALVEGGCLPCGLGARDTLRTEAGMHLYGHEMDESTTPFEARLGWVVSLGKGDFVGRDALARLKVEGPTRQLVGLLVGEGGVPRPGFSIVHDGETVGALTSGTFSPSLRRNIGLGYVPVALAQPDQRLGVVMRGREVEALVTRLPFVPHRTRPRARRTAPASSA